MRYQTISESTFLVSKEKLESTAIESQVNLETKLSVSKSVLETIPPPPPSLQG